MTGRPNLPGDGRLDLLRDLFRRLAAAGHRPHLDHQPELIRDAPVLDDLAILEAEDVDHVHLHRTARRSVTHDGPGVDATTAVPRPYRVAGDREVLDRQGEVGHPRVEGPYYGLGPITAGSVSTLVLHDIVGHEFVEDRQVALSEPNLDEAARAVGEVGVVHDGLHSVELVSIQIEVYSIEMQRVKREGAGRRPTLRDERAQVTRRRIADTARRLFAQQGYAVTTLAGIAAEAGVAVQTVYAVYGSKAGILHVLRESAMNQPEAEALYAQAMGEPSPARCLELFAQSIRRRWELSGDVVVILRDAGTADVEVRAGVAVTLERRRAGIRALVSVLGEALRPGMDVAQATAIVDALTLPEVYAELVDVQGWAPDAFEGWLAAALSRELLGAG